VSLSRRHFVLGTAAGLILPSYFEKALAFLENTGEPLLVPPTDAVVELIAMDWHAGGFELNLGDPYQEPPEMTVREFARRYWGGEAAYLDAWGYDDCDFARKMDFWEVIDCWGMKDSPNARAYRLLDGLDLGHQFAGPDAVGTLEFIEGPCPGSNYVGVEAADQLSVSLLQKRLNDLNMGIRIRMESD